MQPIAAWLIARPLHAVLALALTLVLPFAQIFSGAAIVMLVLYGGARTAALQGLIAIAVLAALSLVTGGSLPEILVNGLFAWLPVFLLAWLLRRSRSLTLTLQVSAIAAMAVTLGFYIVVADPTAYWMAVLTDVAAAFRDMGLTEQAGMIVAQAELIAPQMTMVTVLTSWSLIVLVLVLGYAIYQALPGKSAEFGRFCDLRFGRTLALVMAVTSVLALLIGVEWLRNFAFVVFAIFWLQGLSMMHWLRVVGPLPFIVLIVIYAMLPFLNALLVMALAILGYTDAWFDYRARIGKNMAR
ncbi:MAG: DUF2232 domain-containing protein [Proteobacteria bacterium]|nr:DUF2232 domain-containing protein [Pseudomonadota bacterium]